MIKDDKTIWMQIAPFKQALKDDADAEGLIGKVIISLSEFYKNNMAPWKYVQKKQYLEYKVDKDKEIVVLKDGNANQSKISGWYDFCSDGESGGLVRGHRLDPVVHLVHLICSRSTLHGVLADWKAPVTSFFDAFCINLRFIK